MKQYRALSKQCNRTAATAFAGGYQADSPSQLPRVLRLLVQEYPVQRIADVATEGIVDRGVVRLVLENQVARAHSHQKIAKLLVTDKEGLSHKMVRSM